MRLPIEKMEITNSFEGKASESGWLVVDVSKLDLDGVSRIYVSLDDVEALRRRKGEQTDAFAKARELLGG